MRATRVTAAIATCDRPDALARCLHALLSGTLLPREVIVVDQSRDDATQALVADLKSPVRIGYVRQERRGLSASRNAAVQHARSPIIAFTDDDCVPDVAWIATIERTFAAPDAPAGMTGRVLPLGPEVLGLFDVSPRDSIARTEFDGKVIPWTVGTGGNFAADRIWFERIGTYDERLGAGAPGKAAEDADIFYRLLCAGGRIRYEPDAVVYHERQDRSRRLASRKSYGHGVGALCGIWLRSGDPFALRMLTRWCREQCRPLASGLVRRDWFQVHQRLLSLTGTVHGLWYGVRAIGAPASSLSADEPAASADKHENASRGV